MSTLQKPGAMKYRSAADDNRQTDLIGASRALGAIEPTN